MHKYKDRDEAARGLLAEVVVAMEQHSSLDYIVIGGWSPLLLSPGPIVHPGTRDVDLLVSQATEEFALRELVNDLLDEGDFYYSAKHDFQLLRRLELADARDRMFNVDLLHPTEDLGRSIDFRKQIELTYPEQIRDADFGRSIGVRGGAALFDHQLWRPATIEACLPDDDSVATYDVPLLDELGLILTKAKPMGEVKRQRDGFDIAISIVQTEDRDNLRHRAAQLLQESEDFAAAVKLLGSKLATQRSTIESQILEVTKSWPDTTTLVDGAIEFVRDVLGGDAQS